MATKKAETAAKADAKPQEKPAQELADDTITATGDVGGGEGEGVFMTPDNIANAEALVRERDEALAKLEKATEELAAVRRSMTEFPDAETVSAGFMSLQSLDDGEELKSRAFRQGSARRVGQSIDAMRASQAEAFKALDAFVFIANATDTRVADFKPLAAYRKAFATMTDALEMTIRDANTAAMEAAAR
jgi:hypothetical protein